MAEKAVTESDKGTMTEAKGSSAPEAEVKTPDEASKVSPTEKKVEEKPIYTQTQADGLVHMATSESGRLQKLAEVARDEANTKFGNLETNIADIQSERDKLQTDIEELSNDDPKKFDIVKRDKDLREAQGKLKAATGELATQQKDNEAIVTSAKETMLEIAIWDVATEYKGGDPVRLKNLCATLGVTTEEKLKEVAGNIWEKVDAKPPAEKAEGDGEPKEKLSLDPGGGHGSGEKTEEERARERYPKRFPTK